MFAAIDTKKLLLDQRRPLPVHTLKSIREHLIVNWTYHSNAIEGNTLTLSETKVALEGITVGGKTIHEHLEAINHKDAILYVEEIVGRREPLSEWQIKSIHRLILKGIQDEHAGAYRKQNVLISGATHIPPDMTQVPVQMEQFIKWYEGEGNQLHPVERAARVHSDFVKIHPFIDGNGRTARLLLNFELMKNGYPPIVIEKESSAEYYSALDEAHTTGDLSKFTALVAAILDQTFDLYLRLV
ncbi:Fic family protein [Paenibacillus mucilaginosus]|uniref:Filamentation induced by cAMP protein Fic n=1 Tax=Paenibacillus mucilaginosus (strain KNP414) TaxID=1036673 RepID=F8FM22_PAEMK|nr:Fic family protein [Paenibacillus mucilaginosus]AEI45648.1 Filamentation induced by cAMP protein Fic [Paenibacillus mucilaginosus KNP414]MCG7215154.1 Fic family protein [Paenibacillus mucilaginosus]WDM27049.1 Fic family protein [Paenibacillus mucilaginosus]